ncbi:Oidioi.mRNA.OKI2018_I69.chr1.g3841.t1.cds [Oikopleura dioica]|uniref:Oidioi.mRNA.OKI2018_I69.chr1.g3841.t1.cds n=1 Tax=Oikopleura dioica TaxID=34765 RepID=A0ABN7SZN6_OIKDI|nr:Oidioi.mRNA.OKI2018_I69.chr1.g3841.t1.cds [Oikopleura dioica]
MTDTSKITHFEICRFIRDISLKLELLPKVTCSALQIYHHVYDFSDFATFEEINPYNVATSCVWLATKVSQQSTHTLFQAVLILQTQFCKFSRLWNHTRGWEKLPAKSTKRENTK